MKKDSAFWNGSDRSEEDDGNDESGIQFTEERISN